MTVNTVIKYADETVYENFKKVIYEFENVGQLEEFSIVYDGELEIEAVPYIKISRVVDTLVITFDSTWILNNFGSPSSE